MNTQLCRIIREMSQPQVPLPTEQSGKLHFLEDIQAVFFDIYGTLFISCSGDIGVSSIEPVQKKLDDSPQDRLTLLLGKKFFELFPDCLRMSSSSSVGRNAKLECDIEVDWRKCGHQLIASFRDKVQQIHQVKQQQGIPWPEVDVRQIWREIIGDSDAIGSEKVRQIDRWAIEYESQTNPVWPMPNATDCIDRLGSANLTLGIISNAQFYTPLLFPALLNKQLEDLEIAAEMQYYSYREGRAKPDPWMFQQAARALAHKGITSRQTLYVGNDMRNDILPASQIGFRTALFAADRRSLRLRENDPRIAQIVPDIIVTNLQEVVECVLK